MYIIQTPLIWSKSREKKEIASIRPNNYAKIEKKKKKCGKRNRIALQLAKLP